MCRSDSAQLTNCSIEIKGLLTEANSKVKAMGEAAETFSKADPVKGKMFANFAKVGHSPPFELLISCS